MLHPYYEKVMTLLKREEAEGLTHLGKGICTSFDHYKLLVGKVQGIQKAQELMKEGLKAFHEGKL